MTKSNKKKLDLQWQIFIGIVLGLILGISVNTCYGSEYNEGWVGAVKILFGYGGDIFLRLLRMLIIPLVASSIFMAVVNLGNIRELGKVGGKTVAYYMVTTCLAVLAGLVVVNIIHPGQGFDQEHLDSLFSHSGVPDAVINQGVGSRHASLIIGDTLVGMIPKNPIQALAKGDILQVIFFTLFFAVIATTVERHTENLVQTVHGIDRITTKAIHVVMAIAPYCIFFLVSVIFMTVGASALVLLGKYAATVLIGLGIHAFITLPLLVWFLSGYNPLRLFKKVSPALMTAWSTASSAVTLPLTMDCLHKNIGVKKRISSFVLPLGATINMDGTALYESVAVVFIAELMGVELTLSMQAVIFITATLAAIGAAAVPGAGLVTMGIVLTAVGLPLDGIGLILAIDRVLDQFRTSINVWGDTTAAVVIAVSENMLEEPNTEARS